MRASHFKRDIEKWEKILRPVINNKRAGMQSTWQKVEETRYTWYSRKPNIWKATIRWRFHSPLQPLTQRKGPKAKWLTCRFGTAFVDLEKVHNCLRGLVLKDASEWCATMCVPQVKVSWTRIQNLQYVLAYIPIYSYLGLLWMWQMKIFKGTASEYTIYWWFGDMCTRL